MLQPTVVQNDFWMCIRRPNKSREVPLRRSEQERDQSITPPRVPLSGFPLVLLGTTMGSLG